VATDNSRTLNTLIFFATKPVPYAQLIADACTLNHVHVLPTLLARTKTPAAKYRDAEVRWVSLFASRPLAHSLYNKVLESRY